MPLYAVHSRTLLGDICAMSAFTMAFGGLLVAVIDERKEERRNPTIRVAFAALGFAGLLAGYYARGALLGVAAPMLAVGAAMVVTMLSRSELSPGVTETRLKVKGYLTLALGGAFVAVPVAIIVKALAALEAGGDKNLSMWIGAMVRPAAHYPTFDYFVGVLGHALAPWSAFIPFALGRLFLAPAGVTGEVASRESQTRVAIILGASVALGCHGFLAPRVDLIAFVAPAVLAAACGIAIRDFERGAPSSIPVGVGTLVLAGTLHHDFHKVPEKAFQAFALNASTFPESFKDTSLRLWWVVLGVFAVTALFAWMESAPKREPFASENYTKPIRAVSAAFDGWLTVLYFALVAAAALSAAAIWIGARQRFDFATSMPITIRTYVLNVWWQLALAPFVVVGGVVFAADLLHWAFRDDKDAWWRRGVSLTRRFVVEAPDPPMGPVFAVITFGAGLGGGFLGARMLGLSFPIAAFAAVGAIVLVPALYCALAGLGALFRHRASAMAVVGALAAAILSSVYYPALANQLSPKDVFRSYEKFGGTSGALGLLGIGNRAAAYYAGGQVTNLATPEAAHAWLKAGGSNRRFIAMRGEELSKLNKLYREASQPRQNLPVLDARSSQVLLVASSLNPGEANANPLSQWLMTEPPLIAKPMKAVLDDKLEVLGYDLLDAKDNKVDYLTMGKPTRIRFYFRVLEALDRDWEAFIHIDRDALRYNGDHKAMQGKYPMTSWLKGDVVVDDHKVELGPNFSSGKYKLYFGFFPGGDGPRMKVLSGPSDGDNRVFGGDIRIQ
jgi:hypothetical protein